MEGLICCMKSSFGGPWDVAAGAVIVKEAGGFVFDPSGTQFDLAARRVAASNAHLKDAFINALNEAADECLFLNALNELEE